MFKALTRSQPLILWIIVFAQFAGTALWFAGNAIIGDLQQAFQLSEGALGHLVSAVQFGFIAGTLSFAVLTIPDRFSPSLVFLVCAVAGALSNMGVYFLAEGFYSILFLRFWTGFFLAGIYPVGMKIAADWHQHGLGKALGYLVGALVVGTAFPHLLEAFLGTFPWQYILLLTSAIAIAGGLSIYLFVPDGPYRRAGSGFDFSAFFRVFKIKKFRAAAFGYFGHMWELYAFWAFVPFILESYNVSNGHELNVPLYSFLVIASGGVSCVIGGYLSLKWGSKKVAFFSLMISGICCVLSTGLFDFPLPLFVIIIFLWGMTVVSDSPQFSTLVAQSAPPDTVGTALTIVNCIGFSITIFSIQLINMLALQLEAEYLFLVLVIGPVLGLFALRKN